MIRGEQLLNEREYFGDCIPVRAGTASFDIQFIEGPTIKHGDTVLLDVHTETEYNTLIGGNPLMLEILSGRAEIHMVDHKTGASHYSYVEPGMGALIPSDNVSYRYVRRGEEPLLIRDTCPNFDPMHEPRTEDVAAALVLSLSMLGRN